MNDIREIKCEACPRVCPEDYQKMVEMYSRACQERDRANELLRERCIRYAEEAMELKARLKSYEDTGLEPEDIKAAVTPDALIKVASQMLSVQPDHLRELVRAEKEGRLVVLPCGTDVELVRDGYAFKADHWSHTLTAFRDAPENKSGKQIALFSTKEAEEALKGGEG